ncbi:MAG: hypothetical protein EZS28_020745 [Streblomastix strix]|uniref:Uncharacterized protein n=1 Tax=Streblomastix strix TaxID=222440 RepID=A0A5J4VMB2_9EUKA|nr:MAG: hypothetical protein EZS28_020745 [Streblomastix strix]
MDTQEEILEGREQTYQFDLKPYFPSQPVLFKSCLEQFEDEGTYEEIEAQQVNNGREGYIKYQANVAKEKILNFFIDNNNTRPWTYY